MTEDFIRAEPLEGADRLIDPDTAAQEQDAEQEALDEETRQRYRTDPGDPKDRLTVRENDRLMEQNTEREIHA